MTFSLNISAWVSQKNFHQQWLFNGDDSNPPSHDPKLLWLIIKLLFLFSLFLSVVFWLNDPQLQKLILCIWGQWGQLCLTPSPHLLQRYKSNKVLSWGCRDLKGADILSSIVNAEDDRGLSCRMMQMDKLCSAVHPANLVMNNKVLFISSISASMWWNLTLTFPHFFFMIGYMQVLGKSRERARMGTLLGYQQDRCKCCTEMPLW